MPRPYAIHWDQVLRYLPPSLPVLYRVEADGLPAVDSLVQAGTGAEGKAIRQFQAHLLHAMIHRINDLEKSGSADVDHDHLTLSTFRAATLALYPGKATLLKDFSLLELAKFALEQAQQPAEASTTPYTPPEMKTLGDVKEELGDLIAAKEQVATLETENVHLRGMLTVAAENMAGLQTDLKKANTKATVYYTSWKSLERHVNGKAKLVPSDEMNLAAAVTSLVEKGYIQNVQPGGQIPVEIMCSMVAGIAEKLPPAGELPEPKAVVPAADVSGYAELEQINTTLESQLRQAQRDLSEAACWMDTARQHAKNEEFYRDLLDQTAVALQNPDVYKSDDGSTQQDPIRLKIPELVAKLHAMGCENINLLAHQTVLLDKFRSGVRAITDPGEGQDEKLLEMLHRMKTQALYTGNGTHFQAQSMEMRNGVLYRITGLYHDGHDFEPVDFVNTLQADAQPEEPKAQVQPNVIDMAFQGLLDRIMATEQQAPLEDCHTVTAGPLHLRAEFFDGVVVERRWDGFDFAVLTVPQSITPKQELGNHMMGSEYMVETNTLYLLAAWKGEHPSNWKFDAKFDLRPQIINRER